MRSIKNITLGLATVGVMFLSGCAGDYLMILECAKESALYERKLWKEREADSKEIALKQGVEVVELSAAEKKRFQEAVRGVYEKYCADYMDVIEQIIEENNE